MVHERCREEVIDLFMEIKVNAIRVTSNWCINYCYLVVNTLTSTAILIDPAWEQDKIENLMTNNLLKGILLTHHHPDHIHLAKPLAEKYQVPVYMSATEIEVYHFSCPGLIALHHFDNFKLGGIEITPIFTPGHTKGGTSYLIDNNLFTGDTLFIEGCGICKGKDEAGVMFDTLQMLKKRISKNTYIYPGHCYGKSVGKKFEYLLYNNIYLGFKDKNDFIQFRLRPNQNKLFNFK